NSLHNQDFYSAVWWIWRWRKHKIFDNDEWNTKKIMRIIYSLQDDIIMCLNDEGFCLNAALHHPKCPMKVNAEGSFEYPYMS
ncbi:hypothetical protein VIGAN_11229500, partial [Vigna angularis var. angularis]